MMPQRLRRANGRLGSLSVLFFAVLVVLFPFFRKRFERVLRVVFIRGRTFLLRLDARRFPRVRFLIRVVFLCFALRLCFA